MTASGFVARAMNGTWEPVKPTVGQAQEAYQYLYELSKRNPANADLRDALECARHLRDEVWKEHQEQMRRRL